MKIVSYSAEISRHRTHRYDYRPIFEQFAQEKVLRDVSHGDGVKFG